MNTRRRSTPRRLADEERAVSTIVGAVLVLSMIIAVLGAIRVSFVPEWEKDAEWRHMNGAQGQMQGILSLLGQQVNNASAAPLSAPVDLGQGRSSIFSGTHAPHKLAVVDADRAIYLHAETLTVLRDNGSFLGSIDESWTPISDTFENASGVESFRLRLDQVETKNDGDSILLSIFDADGAFAGDLRLTVTKHSADFSVQTVVRDATFTVLYNQGEAFLDTVTPFFLDLLDTRYRFDQVLAATKVPFTVQIDLQNDPEGHDPNNGHADLSASYAVTYYEVGDGGTTLTTSGGDRRHDFAAEFRSDPLLFQSANSYYPNQEFVLEHGAIVLAQGERAIFAVEPNVHATLVDNKTHLQVSLPLLEGGAATVVAARTASVSINPIQTTEMLGLAPDLNLTVQTAFPELWAGFWTKRLLELDGYEAGTHFQVFSSDDTATLVLKGLSPSPSYMDLVLDLRTADIHVRISG